MQKQAQNLALFFLWSVSFLCASDEKPMQQNHSVASEQYTGAYSPLLYALCKDDLPAIEKLLKDDADPNEISSAFRPIMSAKSVAAAQLLLEYKADPKLLDRNGQNIFSHVLSGPTPLLSFFCNQDIDPVAGVSEHPLDVFLCDKPEVHIDMHRDRTLERNLALMLSVIPEYSCELTSISPQLSAVVNKVIAANKIVQEKRAQALIKPLLSPHLPETLAALTTSFVEPEGAWLKPLEHTKLFALFERHAGLQLMPPAQGAPARAQARRSGCSIS